MDKYTFGKNLYELRNKKGLTQKELGKLLGVSDKAVSKWETGEAMPRTAKLVLITDLFGVTMEQLSSEDFDCNAEDFQINETPEQKESRYKKYFDKAMKQYYLLSKFWSVLATGLFVVTLIVLVASILAGGSVGIAIPLWKMVLVYLLPFFILIYAKELYSKLYKNREKTEISDFVPLTLTLIVFSLVFCITGFINDVTKEDVVNFIGCFLTCLSFGVLLCFLKPKNKGRLSENNVAAIFAIALISVGISVGANLTNEVAFFMLLAEFALVSSISDLLIVAVITSVLDNNDYEKNNKGKNKFIKKALVSSVIAFVVISMAFTLFPGLAYKMYCQNMQKGQEINAQWETKDVYFKKGESKRISMDWVSLEIPKELKKSDFESSLESQTIEAYKTEDVVNVTLRRSTDNAFADFDLFEPKDETEEEKLTNDLYLMNFQKYFGFIPSNMYEYQRLAASLDADDMRIIDYPQCVLYTQMIMSNQIMSFGGGNHIYYIDTDETYGELIVTDSSELVEGNKRISASYTIVDKNDLNVIYQIIVVSHNYDIDLLHKIINSVEIDL